MIPYFEIPTLQIGPIPIHSFGILAAAGVLFASWMMVKQARARGLDPGPLSDFGLWALVGGLIGAHLMHVLLYHPEELAQYGPLQLFKLWDGLSSTGGVLGGIGAAILFFRRRGIPFQRYSDSIALGLAPGWAIARLGCFTVHDHPGRLTNFALAVAFPGGPRHDLGLYDAMLLGAISAVLFALARRELLQDRLLALLALLYGVGRFVLDFLRAADVPYSDARYFGLTPAQYVCILLMAYGAIRLALRRGPSLKAGSGAGETAEGRSLPATHFEQGV